MAQQFLRKLTQLTFALSLLIVCGASAMAQVAQPNDMKPGSILFYNIYTSNPSNPQGQDTQINITNTNSSASVMVHLFFIDGSTCTPADGFVSLTPNQTGYFLASDFDPGVTGYIVAVAESGGGPSQFNYLTGDLLLRQNNGQLANLSAVSIAKLSPGAVVPNGDGTASLKFDGVDYEQLPGVVAISTFNSPITYNTTLVLYSPSADLIVGSTDTFPIAALIFDDHEKAFSVSFRIGCFNQISLASLRVLQGLSNIVPVGRTGWMRMGSGSWGIRAAAIPLLGAVLTKGAPFNGGHNLHQLALAGSYTITIPSF